MYYFVKSVNISNSKMQMLPTPHIGLTGLMDIGEATADESLKTMEELELGVSDELFKECCAS